MKIRLFVKVGFQLFFTLFFILLLFFFLGGGLSHAKALI